MENNNKFKKNNIKNCTCYYFDDIIKIEDFDLDNTLSDEKPYENSLVYNISYKTFIGTKPLCIMFNKIVGFIRVYNGTILLYLIVGRVE